MPTRGSDVWGAVIDLPRPRWAACWRTLTTARVRSHRRGPGRPSAGRSSTDAETRRPAGEGSRVGVDLEPARQAVARLAHRGAPASIVVLIATPTGDSSPGLLAVASCPAARWSGPSGCAAPWEKNIASWTPSSMSGLALQRSRARSCAALRKEPVSTTYVGIPTPI